jgi:hypothetical protein
LAGGARAARTSLRARRPAGREIARPPLARRLLQVGSMDLQLAGTMILGLLAVLYAAEVMGQLWLQARLYSALPEETRLAFPPHPPEPWRLFLGSARFHVAFLRAIFRDSHADTGELAALKGCARASVARQALLVAVFLATAAILYAAGWHPLWSWVCLRFCLA